MRDCLKIKINKEKYLTLRLSWYGGNTGEVGREDNEDCAGDWWVPWYKWWKSVEMAWTTDGGEN